MPEIGLASFMISFRLLKDGEQDFSLATDGSNDDGRANRRAEGVAIRRKLGRAISQMEDTRVDGSEKEHRRKT